MAKTYKPESRITGYFNNYNALLLRAYAYDKNISLSDLIVIAGRDLISGIPENERKTIIDRYTKDFEEKLKR